MAVFFNCSKKFLPVLNLRLLHRQATSIMKLASLSKYDLTVDFVGNSGIQVLNQRYRNIDAPTDILSFPTYEIKAGNVAPKPNEILGEEWDIGNIVLAVPYIFEQCQELETSLDARLPRLLTHGVFHMLGYDHENDADYQKMRAREVELLEALRKLYPNDPIDLD